jgi:cytochrome c oxidase assembly protein Cox11
LFVFFDAENGYWKKTDYLPATLPNFRLSKSMAFSPTPSPRMVAVASFNSRPSYDMLCSLTGIEDYRIKKSEKRVRRLVEVKESSPQLQAEP